MNPGLGKLTDSLVTVNASSDPVEAIKAALSRIEDRLRAALANVDVQGIEQETLPRLALLAVHNGLIAPGNADSVNGVAVMANLALVKPWKISEKELTEFLALADATLFAIDLAIRTGNLQPGELVQPA
jgi:hypothetical protein